MNYLPLLRVYSTYDFLSSNITLENYFNFLKKNKIQKASFITTNNLFGVQEFYQKAIANDVQPVIGLTINNFVYKNKRFVVTVFAKNYTGYQNLIFISTKLMSEDDYIFEIKKDFSLLKNLIIIIHIPDATALTLSFSFFNDLQINKIISFLGITETFKSLLNFTQHKFYKFFVPFDAVRYLFVDEFKIYNVLSAIKNKTIISDYQNEGLHFRSIQDLKLKYHEEKLIKNIDFVFQNINLIIPSNNKWNLKKISLPQGFNTSYDYLKSLCQERLELLQLKNKIYHQRLSYELNIIQEKQLIDYFLIVYDYVQFALKKNILIGPGRGSCAGSLVSYLLQITKVDPIKYDLIFERFLNPNRDQLPDIDLDFEDQKRNQVLKYIVQKYGKDHVAQVAAFQRIAFKMSIRDVGKALDINSDDINQMSKEIHLEYNYNYQLALKNNLYLQASEKKYPELFQFAQKIIGLPRQISIHAAGIVISDKPLVQSIGLWKDHNKGFVLQTEMNNLNFLNLIKMDLLGLKNLTIISSILEFIDPHQNKNQFLQKLPLDDKNTYDNLKQGNTFGIFQLESEGMTRLLKKIEPKNINDIALTISLFRPGPLSNLNEFLKRKNNLNKKTFLLNLFDDVLSSTYGIPVYQEQIIKMIYLFADFSLSEGEILRQAMSKKKVQLLSSLKNNFFKKASLKNYSETLINRVWKIIFEFSGYGFNRSHAISYAFIVYWMSYLKTNYFNVFMLFLMNDVMNDFKKTELYLSIWKKQQPKLNFSFSVNFSNDQYRQIKNNIYFPLTLIKYIGQLVKNKIVEERLKNDLFKNVFEFIARAILIGINQKTILKLIYVGALDEFGYNRSTLIFNLEKLILYAQFVIVKKQQIDWSLFALLKKKPQIIIKPEQSAHDFSKELETIGFICNYKFLQNFRIKNQQFIAIYKPIFLNQIHEMKYNKTIFALCVVENISSFITKKTQKEIFFLEVSDETGKFRLGFWKELFIKNNFYVGQLIFAEIKIKLDTKLIRNKSYFKKQLYLQRVLEIKEN